MIGLDIMEPCWQILKDKEEPHLLYPAQDMVKWVNEGIDQIVQRRPDSLVDDDGVALVAIVEIEDLDDAVSVGRRWKTALISWVLFRAFGADAEDEGDAKQSVMHFQSFEAAVMR